MSALPSSQDFYQMLERIYDECKEQTGIKPTLMIFCTGYDSKKTVNISLPEGYSTGEIKASGKDIWAILDEFKRRLGFDQSQKNLLLGAPTIEQDKETSDA